MPLTLEQYATYLDTRDLPWPAPPVVERAKAKKHLVSLPDVRVVTWSVYGTLLAVAGGELYLHHPQKFVMEVALDKTLQEFKMWGSMTRKPGQPSEYLGQMYDRVLSDLRAAPSPGEKYPEIATERIWEGVIKKLLQKEYTWDTNFYGSLNEYSRKMAYFFHASLQGTACYPYATETFQHLNSIGMSLGIIADAQCFTMVQLQRGMDQQGAGLRVESLFDPQLCMLSCETGAKKPSERPFRQLLQVVDERGLQPGQVLHVGSSISKDVVPARKLGMRTGLFAGDTASLEATVEQLKEPSSRPDILLTKLSHVPRVLSS